MDIFGSLYGFTLRGKGLFQTNFGAIISLINMMLVLSFFGYYIYQMLDTNTPYESKWNQYVTQIAPTISWDSMGFGFFISPYSLAASKFMSIEDFKKSFTIIATQRTKGEDGKYDYKDYEVAECNDSNPLWKDFAAANPTKYGLCVQGDPVITKREEMQLAIAIYPCQTSEGYACGGSLSADNLGIFPYTQEKSVNINNYEEPIVVFKKNLIYFR